MEKRSKNPKIPGSGKEASLSVSKRHLPHPSSCAEFWSSLNHPYKKLKNNLYVQRTKRWIADAHARVRQRTKITKLCNCWETSYLQLAIKFVKKQTKKPMASEQKAKNFTNVFFYPETFPSLAVLRHEQRRILTALKRLKETIHLIGV